MHIYSLALVLLCTAYQLSFASDIPSTPAPKPQAQESQGQTPIYLEYKRKKRQEFIKTWKAQQRKHNPSKCYRTLVFPDTPVRKQLNLNGLLEKHGLTGHLATNAQPEACTSESQK